MNFPKKFKRYPTIEKLTANSFMGLSESEMGEYSAVCSDGTVLSNKEWLQALKDQKVWGFVDDKGTVHYWIADDAPIEILLTFIAHETGHLNGKHYKNHDKEEEKAHLFDQIAVYAYKQALKIIQK